MVDPHVTLPQRNPATNAHYVKALKSEFWGPEIRLLQLQIDTRWQRHLLQESHAAIWPSFQESEAPKCRQHLRMQRPRLLPL
jgi:hypothetical protein